MAAAHFHGQNPAAVVPKEQIFRDAHDIHRRYK
jgi:hypothetical protein